MSADDNRSPVSQSFGELGNWIDIIQRSLTVLQDQIEPILGPDPATVPEEKAVAEPRPRRSVVADHVMREADRLSEIGRKLEELLDRIEL